MGRSKVVAGFIGVGLALASGLGSGEAAAAVTHPVPSDFDGSGGSDIAVFRPSTGRWYPQTGPSVTWGLPGDIPVPAQWDTDAATDVAVFRPTTGRWYLHGVPGSVAFGEPGDIPVPAQWDTDAATDIAVYRPLTGRWLRSGQPELHWGTAGDVPVPADYDGDGDADAAVFRPATGRWYVHGLAGSVAFGVAGDIPVPGQWDADAATDIAVFRPTTGRWYVHGAAAGVAWGVPGDIPVPGHWDADTLTDMAVFRPFTGQWYVHGRAGAAIPWGLAGDIPTHAYQQWRAITPLPIEAHCGTLPTNAVWQADRIHQITCPVTVPTGVTLRIDPGATVKVATYSSNAAVVVRGSMVAAGGVGAPITFTSNRSAPAAGDWGGIEVTGNGTIDLRHTNVRYATVGLDGTTNGAVSIVGGTWSDFIHGGVSVIAGPVTTHGLTVNNSGTRPAYWAYSEQLDLNRLTGNTATGGDPTYYLAGTVTTTSTWHNQPAPWLLGPEGCSRNLTIAPTATVTLQPGTTIKATNHEPRSGCGSNGPALEIEGTLVANGTPGAPITFTSNRSAPAAGDWGGIEVTGNGTITGESMQISYAATALDWSGADGFLNDLRLRDNVRGIELTHGNLGMRGIVTSTGQPVRACNYGAAGCSVDASHVDWGTAAGPRNPDGSWRVCGQVTVDPWVGQAAGGPATFGSIPNCDGSPTPAQRMAAAVAARNARISQHQIDCSNGFEDACEAMELYFRCFSAAVDLANQSSGFPVPYDAGDAAGQIGGHVVDGGSAYLRDSASPRIASIGAVTGFFGRMLGVVSTILNIADAYNRC